MSKQLRRYNDDNRDLILNHLSTDEEERVVILTEKQQQLLTRWRFADEKLREQKYRREQVASFIMNTFGVSRDTAYKDIVNAEFVFSSSYPLNKKYMIGLKIERLQKRIDDAYLDGDRIGAAMLEKVQQKYIEMYPDYTPPRAPKKIILKFTQNILNVNMTAEQAFEGSEEILKQLKDADDY